ncbi:hypothetical protein P3T73_07855 [Kiritimatiellota bacterium B12222]|nr:hypothetical protein P3T73_07855 [Kiritimatiellota bacterium B12222]
MMIRIEILDGPEKGIDHSFRESTLRMGASSANEVPMTGDGVLEVHATIDLKDSQGLLRLGPEGGEVRVNGTLVNADTLLQPGDQIQLGGQTFLYKLIPFPTPEQRRRVGVLEWITLGAIVLGGLGQAYFLFGTARSLRSDVDVALLRATATPLPTPNAQQELVPTPTPISQIIYPTPIPTPAVTTTLIPTPTPLPEAVGKSLDELTRDAREFAEDGDDLNAERLLQEALRKDPKFLPAKMELAKLYGRSSSFDESIALWEEIMQETGPASMDYMDARLELQVMKRRKALLSEEIPTAPRKIPTPRASTFLPTPAFPEVEDEMVKAIPQIKVEKIRMERFPSGPRHDQFRMLYFELLHQSGTPAVQKGTIKVVVSFFEQQGSKVMLAAIPEPRIQLDIDEGLAGDQRIDNLSAAYDVPKGQGSPDRSYYGAVIQVYIGGKEVNRAADPAFLLDYIR